MAQLAGGFNWFRFCLRASLLSGWFAWCGAIANSQQTPANPEVNRSSPSKQVIEEGIPVTDSVTVEKCSVCHARDEKGNLTRISWIRTTPEGWEEAIKRMVRLHSVNLQIDEARKILQYLSNQHGLAPEEAAPVEYMAEQRMLDEKVPNETIAHACKACHALGRPLSWRRSANEWKALADMHVALYPDVVYQAFERHTTGFTMALPVTDSSRDDKRHPVEVAIEYFSKSAPLHTPEWEKWRASMQAPKLGGRWLVSGHDPGKGNFFGEMVITSTDSLERFTTKTKLTFPRDNKVVDETGSAMVYTGYAWRGRSKSEDAGSGPEAPAAFREVMMVSRDRSQLTGRWFWGAYNEFGMDVTLRRAGDSPVVFGVDVPLLQAGTSDNHVRIFGDNLPKDIATADVDLGPGVTVKKILGQNPGQITVIADVAKSTLTGPRDVAVKSFVLPAALAVYDHIDYLKVLPETPLARLGGGNSTHVKGYVQFEAIAYSNGPDGVAGTEDDIELGPVPAAWKMEEFVASYGDDDTQFVGTLDPKSGLFTPALDGPSPKRQFSRNNYGDVWAVATYKPAGAAQPVVGRSYLVVAVPNYLHWDQPEVAQ
jgi:quinohemoprotein amine dehydrogenase